MGIQKEPSKNTLTWRNFVVSKFACTLCSKFGKFVAVILIEMIDNDDLLTIHTS